MSVLDKHHDALEVHETMFGTKNGRLAVSLDLLTDALALVGQHGVIARFQNNLKVVQKWILPSLWNR